MHNENKNQQLKAQAVNYVREIINITAPGHRIPGIRQLMINSRIGRIRLEKALQEFVRSGTLEIRPQSGCYRSIKTPAPAPLVFIHFSHRPIVEKANIFNGGVLKHLREKAAAAGQTLEVIHAAGLSTEELCSVLKNLRTSQAFILSAYSADTVNHLREYVPYTVSINPRYQETAGSELRDSPDMTAMQMEYLFNRNYRNIAYIHNAEEHLNAPVQFMRLFDYYRIMAEHGIKVEPEWVFSGTCKREEFFRLMHRFICCKRPADSVIIPGSSLKMLYDFCALNGLLIGRDLPVICCDNVEPDLVPHATTVTNSPQEIGKLAWQVMQETLQGRIVCTTTKLKIITGETLPYLTPQKKPRN